MSDQAFTGSIPDIYDRYMGPMFFEPFARDMARRFEGFEGALLETAAGSGQLTRALAQAAPKARIVATDLNAPMLARAAEVVDAPNIEWRQADALALPFEDGGFEAVVCQFGVMFFPDKATGFSEARRVLKPGGRFVFSVWDELEADDLSEIVDATVASLFPDDPPSFFQRVPFGYHDRDLICHELTKAGFDRVAMEAVRLDTPSPSARDAATGLCFGTPLANEIDARDPARRAEVLDAVTAAIARRYGDGPVVGQAQALVVTGQRP